MIILKDQQPIGGGDDRIVYRDPTNPERCIKIARVDFLNDFKPEGFNETLYWLSRLGQKKYFDFNYVDVEYASLLGRRASLHSFAHIPKCFGLIDTDLGAGVSWEYICNHDQTTCKSLRDYSEHPEMPGEKEKRLLWHGLDAFFSWQLKEVIMLREIAYTNTLIQVQQDNRFKLYHIDAIGCADFIPLAKYSRFVAKLRIKSKVGRFRKRMITWLGPPPSR